MTPAYGDADRQQLIEYVHGDAELEWAIAQAIARIPADAHRIVHLGCGIGWFAFEAKRHRPHASVIGFDPSESAVRAATVLFGQDGLDFEIGDLAAVASAHCPPADVLILSGSEELLAEGSRLAVCGAIAAVLGPDGVMILHLRALDQRRPSRPSDRADSPPRSTRAADGQLEWLAEAIGGRVTVQSVASPHAVAERIAVLERARADRPGAEVGLQPVSLEARRSRAARTRLRLGVRVTHDGYLVAHRRGPAVLIVSPLRNAPSETFIKAQIEGLPARVEVLFGAFPHLEDEEGKWLTPRWARVLRRALEAIGPQWSARVDAYWLDRFFSQRRVRVDLAEYGPTGASLLATCQRRSLPLVTQFLGFDASDRTVVDRLRPAYGRLLEEEAATVAVSPDIERRLYGLGARLGSVHWIPCGVDVDRFQGADPELNPPVFVAAGRFVEKKAPHLTLLAFSRVLAEVPAARLQMVGGGPLLDACQQLANALGMAGSVEFLGFRSHEELSALMRGARAFVQHSMTAPSGDSEGMPVAILEAGASGLPVVATRHGGIPEAVVDGETGFLVEEGDVGAMADRMRQLALDPALAGRLGARARAHVHEHFQLSETLGQLWGVLQLAMSDDLHRTMG